MELESMKYADLQRLAKEVGLKANMKADKLLKALKEHYEQQENSENGNVEATAPPETESQPKPEEAAFVTKRRGRGQKSKRKHPDDGDLYNEPKEHPSPEQSDMKPSEPEERRASKRKRVSSDNDAEVAPTPKESQEKNGADPSREDPVPEPRDDGEDKKMDRAVKKIPRHEGLLKKRKTTLKPTTPNFKKLHEAHFNKMESIDSYVQRKNKQMEMFRNSVKELKTLSEKTILKPVERKTPAGRPNVNRASLFSPGIQEKRAPQENRRLTELSASKPALKDSTAFKPTVLTTNKINVRFTQATQDNEHKRSLVKTPARMSPHVIVTSTPGRKSDVRGKSEANKTSFINKTPGTTPFIFSGNTSLSNTPGTNKKKTFDLKASLSRPLTYKPHKGKLKPFGPAQENTNLNKSQTISSQQKNYKQHQVQTREDRRTKHTEDRKQKKEKMLGARRGLVMA
ncbi:nucleolar and spindle-associated protein 1 [Chanos chanos]|uniref:Nucleolar and spindle-associated protein 1 n=1 Tax=Chanos chanos TaxID=29144 RepID=A0A6J2V8P8_CHACN|nr:nucleolar and spindle-associated protein 1 [Chanos chanos]